MAVIEFDKLFSELVCDDAPITKDTEITDPWDGEKPHAENGFVVKYCLDSKSSKIAISR